MCAWYSHERIDRLLKFTFEIRAESPLRIGAGRNVAKLSPVDLPVLLIRIGEKDLPYIPGSSLKGVFRTASEFLARSYGLNVCLMGEGCKNSYNEELQEIMKTGNVERIREILSKYCLVCKIYGSATFRSHINFEDAYPSEGCIPSRSVKTGIAIDRKSGAVKTGALYQVEFVDPGAIFNQTTSFINVPNYGIGLFSEIIENVNSGFIKVGGFKSRGFGKVSMKPKKLEGFVILNGEYKSVESIESLPPVDNDDEVVEIESLDENALMSLMERFKEVWRKYVKKRAGRS
jgi:CRISPR-associated RAMP protein (TIGR02581 family)